jgi:signal transduction histidine kinase
MMASRAFDERHGGQTCGRPAAPAGTDTACPHYDTLRTVQRDLHDQVGSSLAGISMTIDVARRSLATDRAEADRVLTDLRADVTSLMDHVRQLLTGGPRPHGGNVAVALRAMLSGMSRAAADRMAISVRIDPRLGEIPDDVAWAAFWIVREAMTNVLKHSGARHCDVTLSVGPGELYVRVQDDGVGMHRVRRSGGAGLANMTSRATERGGWCSIEPTSPRGVAVTAWFPLPARYEEDQ